MTKATVITGLLLLWIGTMTSFLAWASYEECRRAHPNWYCIAH